MTTPQWCRHAGRRTRLACTQGWAWHPLVEKRKKRGMNRSLFMPRLKPKVWPGKMPCACLRF